MEADGTANPEYTMHEWFDAAERKLNDPSGRPLRLLKLIRAGKLLLRRQRLEFPEAERASHSQVQALLRRLQTQAEESLRTLDDPAERDKCLDLFDVQVREDEWYLSDLLTKPDLDDLTRGYLLHCFRWDLAWYSTVLALLEDEAPADPTVVAEIHLAAIQDSLGQSPELGDGGREAIDRQLRDLSRKLLHARIQAEIRRPTENASANELWTRRFLLSRLQAEVEYLANRPETRADGVKNEVQRWLGQLADYRKRLSQSALESIENLTGHERFDKLEEIVVAADGDVKEIITLLEDLPLDEAVQTIDLANEDMVEVHSACKRLAATEGWDPDQKHSGMQLVRRARRIEELTGKFSVEKRLKQRMIRLFGPTFVQFLDRLILILIFAITALFVEELVFELMDPSPIALYDVDYFAWIDLAICSVLMGEFLLKFCLADRKWKFFKDPQHWLGEFVASVPYAFLAHFAHQFVFFEGFHLLRLMRLARLPHLARVGRLVIFAQRALDQLVRRHATIFNRNIILFEPEEAETPESRHRHLLFTLRERYSRRTPEVLSRLSAQDRLRLAGMIYTDLAIIVDHTPLGEGRVALARTPAAREIRVEALVRELIEMTPERLVEQMGQSFAVSVSRYIRLFDVVLIRQLPVIRTLIASSQKGAAEVAALAMNYAGHCIQSVVNLILFFADLHGTISAPIFLDRLGTTLVNATQRPAKRLLTLGGVVLFVTILFWAFDVHRQELNNRLRFSAGDLEAVIVEPDHPLKGRSFPVVERRMVAEVDSLVLSLDLDEKKLPEERSTFVIPREWTDLADPPPNFAAWMSAKLNKLLGWPVIILGVVCLIPLFVGNWLRKIANQAVEQSERLVEAQFAAQTKALKAKNLKQDWRFLAERVVAPELELRSCDDHLLKESCPIIDFKSLGTPAEYFQRNPELIFLHNIKLLYEDYLDGALFHRSDNKTTTQLLGNMALTNLRRRNLEHSLKEAKRLSSLDLGRRGGSLLGGPYLWFNYITRMITQETAKLLLDYNRNAIPLDQLACSPHHTREKYRCWLAERLGVAPSAIQLPEPVGAFGDAEMTPPENRRPEAEHLFECVDFTAIDFLAENPERDREITAKYGPLVAELMNRDRQRNVRRAFRSFPLHTVPLQWRTINLFQLYETYLANGKGFLLPFRISRWVGALLLLMVRRTYRLVREILNPTIAAEPPEVLDSYSMAKRKIHRMRKPAYMETLWLRARFDVEYIGLPLPLVPLTVGSDSLIETDLEYIGATRRDRLAAERLRQQQRERLTWIERWLRAYNWDFHTLPYYLRDNFPYLQDRAAEVLRALVTACILDHDDLFTLGSSIEGIRQIIEYTRNPDNKSSSLPIGLPPPVDCRRPLWYRLKSKKQQVEQLLQTRLFADCDEEHRARIHRCLRKNRLTTQGWWMVLLSQGGDHPTETMRRRLVEVIRRTDLWSNEILALRTIQTLTMLDVHHYGEMVWKLGGYDAIEDRDLTAGLPIQNAAHPLAGVAEETRLVYHAG